MGTKDLKQSIDWRRGAAAAAAALFIAGSGVARGAGDATADRPQDVPKESQEDLQPKFVWGLLVNIALKYAASMFADWLISKLTADLSPPGVMQRLLLNSKQVSIVPLAQVSPLGAKSAGAPENAVPGESKVPFKLDQGRENFQAVHVAIVGFDQAGKVTGLRPLTAGFRSGDRIKLKVLPTFDGILVIENITPTGVRKQIFPPDASTVIAVKQGLEVLVPMADNAFFEFGGATGDDQLVITIRDPRAFGDAVSRAPANRKDDELGSSFIQETTPNTYPLISQSLRFKHLGK